MRLLMLGDIVGRPGRKAVKEFVPELRKKEQIDFVIANGENSAGGVGITQKVADELFTAGIDVLTTGNHVWDKKEAVYLLDQELRILRPANYPPGTPGQGANIYQVKSSLSIGVLNLSGTVFMDDLACPFRTGMEMVQRLLEKTSIIIVDFHAEATAEKLALAKYLDGYITALCGTHTHIQTADEQILAGGTAYITDLGMVGPVDSVIGVTTKLVVEKFLTKMPVRFEVASGPAELHGVIIDINEENGKALSIRRVKCSQM